MIEKIKQRKNYILSFFIPLVLLLLLFFAFGFFFSDGKTIFVCDLQAQYKALYGYFREHFFSTYSFSKGIGGSMVGTYAYYLASPFLFLFFLFPSSKLYLATLLMLILKLCTAGLTMYTYLHHHSKDKKYLLIFSTSYVFMSYVGAYFFHIMWMDAIYMLPLVALGIDKIIEKRKPLFYILSLMITILTNYYMGYIVCLFSVLYFFYTLYLSKNNKEKKRKCFWMFFTSSLISGLLTSFLMIPTALELADSVRSSVSSTSVTIPSVFKVLSSLFLGSHNYLQILSKDRYHIYTGIFTFILSLLYFLNPKIPKREKKASFLVVLLFILSIFVPFIDSIWRAFSITACFSGRYMFVFSFFILYLAAKSFDKINYIKIKHLFFIAPIYPILAILILWCQFPFVKTFLVLLSVLLFFFYLFLLYFSITYKEKSGFLLFLITFLVCAELFINLFFMLSDFHFQYKQGEVGNSQKTAEEINKIKKKDTDFYRMEKLYNRSMNDGLYFDYHGVQVFLSTISERQYAFFIRLGYSVFGNIIEYNRSMPAADSLLGVRYLMVRELEHPYYDKISSFSLSHYDNLFYNLSMDTISVYENKYALNLGTIIPKKGSACKKVLNIDDRLAYQNAVISCLYGEDIEIYEKIPLKKVSDNKYILSKDKKYNVYFYPNIVSSFLEGEDVVELFIDGNSAGEFTSNAFVIQEFVNHDTGRDFTIELKSKSDEKYIPYAYYFREDVYEKVFEKLGQNPLKIVEDKGSYIKGRVMIEDEEGYLFTTIPYDTGFTVLVDGKEVKYEDILDTFIGVPMKKGEHTIEFKFVPRGLKVGVFMSLLTFVFMIFYVRKKKNGC